MSVSDKTNRIMVYIPETYKDMYLELSCKHKKKQFLAHLPTLIMRVVGDDINCVLDRKCPCECSDKYEHFKLRKTDLSEWLNNNQQFYKVIG